MKISKPDDVLFLQGYVQRGGRKFLIATLGYMVQADGTILPEADTWAYLARVFPTEPFDTGLRKSRGVFAVAGKAHAPSGVPVAEMAVRARFGALGKTLHVFGRRHWKHSVVGWHPSAAEPFTDMPVDLAHAYGGPGFPENPEGLGWLADPGEAHGASLPYIELPGAPMQQPGVPPPQIATFGNLSLGAPSRMRWMGTVDERWQAERFPGLPDDLDERWFDVVPQDQCGDAYWHGDEVWSVTGMHPEKDTVEGQLPRLRPRLLVQRAATSPWAPAQEHEAVGTPQEAKLDLDTVWLFPNDERVLLLYRAAIPVQREDAGDIAALAMFTEPVEQPPQAVPELTQKWVEEDFSIVDKIPDILAVLGGLATAAALVMKIKDYRQKKKEEKEEQERKDAAVQQVRQAQAAQPASATQPAQPAQPAQAVQPVQPPQPAQPAPAAQPAQAAPQPSTAMAAAPSVATVPAAAVADAAAAASGLAQAASGESNAEQWADEVWADICRSYDESWEEGREMLRLLEEEHKADFPNGFGVDPGPFVPPPRPALEMGPGAAVPANLTEMLQSEVEASIADARSLFHTAIDDAMGDHPEMAGQLHATLDSPPGSVAPPTPGQMEQMLADMPPDLRARAEAELQEMEASFQALHDEIVQTFQDGGADSGGAMSAAAGMGRAPDISAAAPKTPAGHPAPVGAPGVSEADGQALPASEAAVTADVADVAGEPVETADPVDPADAAADSGSGSDPASAAPAALAAAPVVLAGADLRGADLRGADYAGATLQDCDFSGAQMAGAKLTGAVLKDCDLCGADLTGAALDDADLSGSSLRGAKLDAASAQRATFSDSDLSGADFGNAELGRATFERCRLDDACFSQASMADATLSGVAGESVDLSGVKAPGLRMDEGSRLPKADMTGASLQAASIQDSHLRGATLHGANLDGAFLRASDMGGAGARGASARGATLKDMQLADTSWLDTNLMETAFDQSLLHGVDFTGSNLYAAQTRNAAVRGVQLRDTVLDLCHILGEHGRA